MSGANAKSSCNSESISGNSCRLDKKLTFISCTSPGANFIGDAVIKCSRELSNCIFIVASLKWYLKTNNLSPFRFISLTSVQCWIARVIILEANLFFACLQLTEVNWGNNFWSSGKFNKETAGCKYSNNFAGCTRLLVDRIGASGLQSLQEHSECSKVITLQAIVAEIGSGVGSLYSWAFVLRKSITFCSCRVSYGRSRKFSDSCFKNCSFCVLVFSLFPVSLTRKTSCIVGRVKASSGSNFAIRDPIKNSLSDEKNWFSFVYKDQFIFCTYR